MVAVTIKLEVPRADSALLLNFNNHQPSSQSSNTGFSLEIYFQMVNSTIGRSETPYLHSAIEILSG